MSPRRFAFYLSIATFIQSAALLQISRTHSAIGTFLFMELNLSETTSTIVDVGGAVLLCFLSLLLVFICSGNEKSQESTARFKHSHAEHGNEPTTEGRTQQNRDRVFLSIVGFTVAFWMFLVALTTFINGGSFGARFALFAHFARIGLPLTVIGFYWQKEHLAPFIKIAISVTFISHGIEALTGHPGFIDYMFTGMQTLFGLSLSELQSTTLLQAVGIMDILCGLLLLATQSKKLILWMAFWGLMTASLRIFGFGAQNWGELAIRVSHFALPFALYYYWRHQAVQKTAL